MRQTSLLAFVFVLILDFQMPGQLAAAESAAASPGRANDPARSAASTSSTTTVQAGDNLGSIAKAKYGHARFDGFIARLNGLADIDDIQAGMTLQTPALPAALESSGLAPRYQPSIMSLSRSVGHFYTALPAYLVARRASALTGGRFQIPAESRHALTECAEMIDVAVAVLSESDEGHKPPDLSIAQFSMAARQLRRLAEGHRDRYGYDFNMVGQRYALGFTNLLIWVRMGHR